MSNDSKSWRDRWLRWRDLDYRGKMLRLTVYILVIGFLTFLATVGAGAGWFSGQPAAETSIPQVNPTTTTIATTSTSLDALSYEYDPSSSQTPERIGEGESHVFFDRDERGLTVQIGSIDDDLLTASSVTAFVSGEGTCRRASPAGRLRSL